MKLTKTTLLGKVWAVQCTVCDSERQEVENGVR